MEEDVRSHLSHAWSRYTDLLAERAEGVYVWAASGRRYLDFTSGVGVTNTGHCHPQVVAAAQEQVAKMIHGQSNIFYHQPLLDLMNELLAVVPDGLDGFFFSNSGAEAVEAAVKLSRQATGRPNIIVFQGGFHGRTLGTMSLTTSNTIYSTGYSPLMPGVFVAPFPYAYRYGWSEEDTVAFCLRELSLLLATQTAPEETAAVLVEPILGEGGYVVPPAGFLNAVRSICDEHGMLFIADEIQSGFGRSGRWFAHEYDRFVPDILVMAKGLASGFPLSGIAYRRPLMDNAKPGSHGGTYGGNAVSCAAAAASVRVIRDQALVQNSVRMGEYLIGRLRDLQRSYQVIGDVRGLGLMIGVEFSDSAGRPDAATAKEVRLGCLDDGLILLTCGPFANIIRWIPPLVINQQQLDAGLSIFERALEKVAL